MKHSILMIFLLIISVASGSLYAGESVPQPAVATVELFSPQGTVKNIRQVAVRFSDTMVPFGDPRGFLEPFEVNCPEKGVGRWADQKNWVYDFDHDLPSGIQCDFRVKKALKSLTGKDVVEKGPFSFSTGGPAVVNVVPYKGYQYLDEEQIFALTLDGEVDETSLESRVIFLIEGINESVGFRIIAGKEKEGLMKSVRLPKPVPPNIFIQAKQRFPSNARVKLIWGKGVSSKSGIKNENDQTFEFKVRTPFAATFHCERENLEAACLPVVSMSLQFSSPVLWEEARKIILKSKKGELWKAHLEDPKQEESRDKLNTIRNIIFKGPFPEKESFSILLPPAFSDDAGRKLSNASKFPLTVSTDEFPPLAKFSARFGILELKGEPVLPVTLRNLEPEVKTKLLKISAKQEGASSLFDEVKGKILKVVSKSKEDQIFDWLQKMFDDRQDEKISLIDFSLFNQTKKFSIPKPNGAKPFEVVGIPFKEPGFYIVELESRRLGQALLGQDQPFYVPTAVLVTNLSVHLKWANDQAMIWVTTLNDASPVKDAHVMVKDCTGKLIGESQTDSQGIARVFKIPPQERGRCSGYHPLDHGLFVIAQTREDMSFVHSSWEKGIEPWRFQVPTSYQETSQIAHTILDRTLLRAGETVHMKHLIRQPDMHGFIGIANNDLPTVMTIRHRGSEQEYSFPLTWDSNGLSETEWAIPREAKLGSYDVILARGTKEFYSGLFRVEEFRIPLMKGVIQFPKEPLIAASNFKVDLSVQFLTGGGAGGLPVKFRHHLEPYSTRFDSFDGFVFANGPVALNSARKTEESSMDEEGDDCQCGEAEEEGYPEEGGRAGRTKIPSVTTLRGTDLKLDSSGSVRTEVDHLPKISTPMGISTELEFKDPGGETQTVSSTAVLWPSKRLIGIKPDSWALSKDSFKFKVAVVNIHGKPIEKAAVQVALFERKTYSHRKRLIGGFYAYEHVTETKKIKDVCEGETENSGLLICDIKSPVTGNLILEARTIDEAGHEVVSNREVWVAGSGEWWFDVEDNDRIDLIPEKKHYEPGETARFQVRMPFREATALVTIEREGIIRPKVVRLSGKSPVIEIPVEGIFSPNIYVSVLVVRGRVGEPQPTALVDLGKPAFKLGIAEINVGWKAHELKVTLTPDRLVYKVRDKAKVKISVTAADGNPLPPGSEVAVAAVDEGLLELMPNGSWDLLAKMMGRRGYEVKTSTAQMEVIGKRHFGLKALPQGGDGGGGNHHSTRELFDTLLFWKGKVILDANGKAEVEIPLNDSLTSFKLVGVASAGLNLFGTGYASIRSTQELILFSGIPQLVREGDRFKAIVTVKNSSQKSLEVNLSARVDQLKEPLPKRTVTLNPGEAKEIKWDILVPTGPEILRYEVEAKEKGGFVDRLKVSQKVVSAVPVRTFQATLSQIAKEEHFPVKLPPDALPDKGEIHLLLQSTLSGSLPGVMEYMRHYSYRCMEQQVSRAVALQDDGLWNETMGDLPGYLDSDGLAKFFPLMTDGSEVLTSYILSIANEAGRTIPSGAKEKMIKGLLRFLNGQIHRRPSFPTADLTLRKLMAIEALSRNGIATPDLLSSISVEPNLWPTSAVLDWFNILQRVTDIPEREKRLKEVEQIIRSRLNFQGTTMGFSTDYSDGLWWLMVSPDSNAVRLVLSLVNQNAPQWKEDLPRIVSGALGRQHRGSWDLTLANAWGVLAMEKFSKAFETTPVTGETAGMLAGEKKTISWKPESKGNHVSFNWPKQQEELSVKHHGEGKPWLTVQSLAAVPLKVPLSTGYRIKKTITPIDRKVPGKWTQGDIARVRLEMEAQADMTWVAVHDPIPAGSTILTGGLGRSSQLAQEGEKGEGWVWPVYEERSFESFKSYFEYVPKGHWSVEYTIRFNNEGLFLLPSTRVEAMYSPEMFGEIPNANIEVIP